MPPKEFKYYLSDNAYVSVHFLTNRGKVIDFVVKLNYVKGNETHEVIRFDTAHGGVHKDILLPNGSKYRVINYSYLTNEEGVNFATDDLEEHFEFYIERFQQWLKQKEEK